MAAIWSEAAIVVQVEDANERRPRRVPDSYSPFHVTVDVDGKGMLAGNDSIGSIVWSAEEPHEWDSRTRLRLGSGRTITWGKMRAEMIQEVIETWSKGLEY